MRLAPDASLAFGSVATSATRQDVLRRNAQDERAGDPEAPQQMPDAEGAAIADTDVVDDDDELAAAA